MRMPTAASWRPKLMRPFAGSLPATAATAARAPVSKTTRTHTTVTGMRTGAPCYVVMCVGAGRARAPARPAHAATSRQALHRPEGRPRERCAGGQARADDLILLVEVVGEADVGACFRRQRAEVERRPIVPCPEDGVLQAVCRGRTAGDEPTVVDRVG